MTKRYLTYDEIILALNESSEDEAQNVNHDSQNDSDEEIDDANDDSFLNEEDHVSNNSDIEDVVECSDDESNQPTEPSISTAKHLPSRDKTEWFCEPQLTGRVPTHNIIKGAVDKVILSPGTIIEDPNDAFRLYITNKIVMDIVEYTNTEATRIYQQNNYKTTWKTVDFIEMEAFLGLLLAAGHLKMSKVSTRRLWSYLYGTTIFRATMGHDRFVQLMRFLRFDDRSTRSERRKRDKLAPIRDIWESINQNLKKHYMPGESITVDEQLVAFRGRVPFKQYIPSKPAKYGMKIFWVNDSTTGYPLGGIPYLGKENGQRALPNIGERIVGQLCAPYFGTNRNVTCDNFFTSMQLALELKNSGLTMVGTLRKNKPYIPNNFQPNRTRPLHSSVFGFTKLLTLVSYTPRIGKGVILLSSMHHDKTVVLEKDNKPEIIMFYNSTKCGTDLMDQMIGNYSCKRRSNRWPNIFFMNLLDVCGLAAYIAFTKLYPNWEVKKKDRRNFFLQQLSEGLIKAQLNRRASSVRNKQISKTISHFQTMTGTSLATSSTSEPPRKKSKRAPCHLCSTKRQIFQVCDKCSRNTCMDHVQIICHTCNTNK